jgi:hypothetical protein
MTKLTKRFNEMRQEILRRNSLYMADELADLDKQLEQATAKAMKIYNQ